MNSNEHIARVISIQLESGKPVVLATIVEVQGSSPRHCGAKMVVTADGKSHGTIGGSLLEAKAIEGAHRALAKRRSEFMELDLDTDGIISSGIGGADSQSTGNSKPGNLNPATAPHLFISSRGEENLLPEGAAPPLAQAPATVQEPISRGMICGGKAVVLLDYLSATAEHKKIFRRWYDAVLAGASFHFLTFVPQSEKGKRISSHALLFPDGATVGAIPAWASQFRNVRAVAHVQSTTMVNVPGRHIIVDPVRKVKTLYCFGAGHVAVPTAHIAATVGFRVMVIDDRAEFANAERFPDADRIDVTKDYRHVFDGLEINGDSFIVIMTRGHQFDRVVLEQALRTRAGYIGMISSRHKRDTVFAALRAHFTKQALERVHAPIGIDIGSETPEEIAVSIAAELIKVRAEQA